MWMRAWLWAVAATIAIGATAAVAHSAAAEKTYLRFEVAAFYGYELDYGSDPRGTFNGTFASQMEYVMNGIAVYDGRAVSIPRGLMIVAGYTLISEERTRLAAGGPRVPLKCENKILNTAGNHRPIRSSGRISISNEGMSVDPGPEFKWNTGCTATESPEFHLLQGGPSFSVPAPPRSRFAGTADFSVGCRDSYSHPFKPPGNPNGHKFTGEVDLWVSFTPFDAEKLTETKKELRDKIDTDLLREYRILLDKITLKDCA